MRLHAFPKGATPAPTGRETRTCTVDDCHRIERARGLCNGHYERWRTGAGTDYEPLRAYRVDGDDNSYPEHAELPETVRLHAACRKMNTDMFFGHGSASNQHLRARTICAGCTVRTQCLEWACTTPDPVKGGVAGGMTTEERDQIRDRKRRTA